MAASLMGSLLMTVEVMVAGVNMQWLWDLYKKKTDSGEVSQTDRNLVSRMWDQESSSLDSFFFEKMTAAEKYYVMATIWVRLIPTVMSAFAYCCLVSGTCRRSKFLVRSWLLVNATAIVTWFVHMVMSAQPLDLFLILPNLWMLLVGLGVIDEIDEYAELESNRLTQLNRN